MELNVTWTMPQNLGGYFIMRSEELNFYGIVYDST